MDDCVITHNRNINFSTLSLPFMSVQMINTKGLFGTRDSRIKWVKMEYDLKHYNTTLLIVVIGMSM